MIHFEETEVFWAAAVEGKEIHLWFRQIMPERWARTAAALTAALALVALTASLAGGRGPEGASRNQPAVLPEAATAAAPLPALPALPALASPDPAPAPGGARDEKEVGVLLQDVAAIRKALLALQAREESRGSLKAGATTPSAAPTTATAADEREPTSVRVPLPAPAVSPPASPEARHERGEESRPLHADRQLQRQPQQAQRQHTRSARRGVNEPGPRSAGFVYSLRAQERLADSGPLARKVLDLKGTAPYWASALDAGPERTRLEAGTDRCFPRDAHISSMLAWFRV